MKSYSAHPFSRPALWQTLPLVLLALCGCLDNGLTPTSQSSSSSSLASVTSSLTLSSVSTDGAQGNCAQLPLGSSDRATCMKCYSSLLASKCPGASSPSQCADPTVAATFDNQVNQCLAASVQFGFPCIRTCSGSQILNGPTCSCVTPPSSGTTSSTDNGQQDIGPPVVTVSLPLNQTPGAFNAATCAPTETPKFTVRNRGGSIPAYNIYRYVSSSCQDGTVLNNGSYSEPTDPVANGSSLYSAIPATVPITADYAFVGGGATTTIALAAAATSSSGTAVGLTPGKTYEIEIDLRLFNQWEGDTKGDYIELVVSDATNILATPTTLFHYTFSNDPSPVTATNIVQPQSYSPRASQAATTMGNDATEVQVLFLPHGNAGATGWFDSRYILHAYYTLPASAGPSITTTFNTNTRFPAGGKTYAVPMLRMRTVQSCAIEYSFTDSNQLTSYYCYRFTPNVDWLTYKLTSGTEAYQCHLAPTDSNYWTQLGVNSVCTP